MENESFNLRYTPRDGGQVILNDPRLSDAFELVASEAVITIIYESLDNIWGWGVYLFDDADQAMNLANCDVYCFDRSFVRAIRSAIGWHLGSVDLVEFSRTLGKSFTAESDTDRIISEGVSW